MYVETRKAHNMTVDHQIQTEIGAETDEENLEFLHLQQNLHKIDPYQDRIQK